MTKYIIKNADSEVEFITELGALTYQNAKGGELIIVQVQDSPQSTLDILEAKSLDYIDFGTDLYTKIKQKVWAFNTLAASSGSPINTQSLMALLSASDNLEKALKTGSLDTAIYVCNQLKTDLPTYSGIADYAILQINTFLGR
jgi:hypothetical protein